MTEFYVKVRPNNSEQAVNTSSSITELRLEQPAENGRANSELIQLMKNILDEEPGTISGHRSRRKKLKTGLTRDEVEKRLEQYGKDSTEK